MTDQEIVAMYFSRSEDAIRETDRKYGCLCRAISMGIVNDSRDCDECLDDTWLTLWNTIPPKEPNPFKAYVCRVAKNLSLKKYEFNHAQKRNSEYETTLNELTECAHSKNYVEEHVDETELVNAINQFLGSLTSKQRVLFLRRYWFTHSVKEIAGDYHISEKTASMRLARIRKKLREFLIREGYLL